MCKVSANKDHEKIADLGKMYNYIMSYNKFQKEPLSVIKRMYWQQYMLLVSFSFNLMTFNASITLFWRSAVRVSSLCVMIRLLYFDLYMSYAQWKVFVMNYVLTMRSANYKTSRSILNMLNLCDVAIRKVESRELHTSDFDVTKVSRSNYCRSAVLMLEECSSEFHQSTGSSSSRRE